MITFFKMQAVGNDFILINCLKDIPRYNINIFTKFVCNRKFNIGADGVILFFSSQIADIKMKIYNSDGTEAEMCGNGIRCLAKLVYDLGIIKKEEFTVETLAGVKKIKLIIENDDIKKIKVDMGVPIFDFNKIPVYFPKKTDREVLQEIDILFKDKKYQFYSVSVGNPHAVCFVNDLNNLEFEKIGSYVENYKYFPKKTNVEFVKIESKNKIKVKVWERGVGRTLGCGTGAIATSAICMKKLYTESEIIVELEGGNIEVKKENENMYLIGNSEIVYQGRILNL